MKPIVLWLLVLGYLFGTSIGAALVLVESAPWVAFPVLLAAAMAMGVAGLLPPINRALTLAGSVYALAETAVVVDSQVDPDVLAALVESSSQFYYRRSGARVVRWAALRREAHGHG